MQDQHFFSGQWQSDFHKLSIQFNENVWRLVNDGHDHAQGSLFGLFCEDDGASFSLDFALKESSLNYNYEFAEAEFFARMYNLDNSCERADSKLLHIDNSVFECGRYQFLNAKFGQQQVTRAMYITDNYVIGIGMAWPIDMDCEPSAINQNLTKTLSSFENDESNHYLQLPIKFNLLISQLKLPN